MNIIIVGCGKIGKNLISSLKEEKFDIIAIDNNYEVVDDVSNTYDVMTAQGSGTDADTLIQANIKNCELLIATTGSDEINMLTCMLAKQLGAKHTVARVRSPEYNVKGSSVITKNLQLAMVINPEMLAAEEIYNIIKLPAAAKIETFSRRHLKMLEMKVKPEYLINNQPLKDLRSKIPFLICCVQREDKTYIPDGNFIINAGDRIAIIAAENDLHDLLEEFGIINKKSPKKVMILGGGSTAIYLTKQLVGKYNVKIVERNIEKCNKLSEMFPKAEILAGDGARQDILLDSGIEDTNVFVSLTGKDEENILISIYANTLNIPKVITKINRQEWIPIADKLNLDSIINPSSIISNIIVRYANAVRNSEGNDFETLYKVMDDNTEAVEFVTKEDFTKTDVPIQELNLIPGVLIVGIIRGEEIIIPSGKTTIQLNDKVVIISTNMKLRKLTDILAKG